MTTGRTPGASTSPPDRILEALDLRASGLRWEEIASQMGYADKSGPSNLVRRYLRTARTEAARYVMELALYRLDRMLAAVWPAALAGDVQAQRAVIRILDRQAKYLRLDGIGDDLPQQAPDELTDALMESLGRPVTRSPYKPWGYHDASDPATGMGVGAGNAGLTWQEAARRLDVADWPSGESPDSGFENI